METNAGDIRCEEKRTLVSMSPYPTPPNKLTRPQSSSRRGQPTNWEREGGWEGRKREKEISQSSPLLLPSHHPFLPHSRAARVMKATGDESALTNITGRE